MKYCPSCKSHSRHRIPRYSIYKYVPNTKSYECAKCGQYYIWLSFFNIPLKIKAKKNS